MDEKQRIWNSVLGEIELNISKPQFNTWIKNTYPISMDDKEIVICVPSSFTRDWLQNKFNTTILNSIQKITGEVKQVRYVVQGTAPPEKNQMKSVIDLKSKKLNRVKKQSERPPQKQPAAEMMNVDYTPQSKEKTPLPQPTEYAPPQPTHSHLSTSYKAPSYSATPALIKSTYTFHNFIVGSSNALAHAAAQSVANNPGVQYNPLFIYGGVGLGKTHLIQAIANHLLQQTKNILYVTSDEFISDLMRSIGNKTMEEFKRRYREVDLLIIDDIQFIRGKEATQYEVFNTFNDLYSHNKQIVFTSDRPPSAIPQLSDRLKSRFEGGMIVDIALPEFETRVAILRSKCQQKSFQVNDEILHVIADKIRSNVRELEGALNKVIARVQLLGTTVTPELVDKLIEGGHVHTKRTLNEDTIIDTVVTHFHISKDGILSKSRKQELAHPRQIIMFLLREELKLTYPNIGEILGGRDHTTVMHAHSKIKKGLEQDSPLEQEIRLIKNVLYNEGT